MIFIRYYKSSLKIEHNLTKEITTPAWGKRLLSPEFMA